jgi:hypothetical protein
MSLIMTKPNQTSLSMFDMMEKAYKFAEIMAQSDIIPSHYRQKPANVFIAVQTAYRMDLDPMLVMQNTYVVSGKLGMNTSFAISLANKSGMFINGIRYRQEGTGENMTVTAYTNLKRTNEEISYTFSYKTAVAEGYTRNPKYKTMPELMLRYRAATLLIRTHAPEVLNGMHMVEELEDVTLASEPKIIEIEPRESKTLSVLDKLNALDTISNNETVEDIENPNQHATLYLALNTLIDQYNVPEDMVTRWCERAQVSCLEEMSMEHLEGCIKFIKTKFEQPVM